MTSAMGLPPEPLDLEEALFVSREPWAMQLVLLDPRASGAQERPTHLAACEATATATARLLDDERSALGGPWHARVARWDGGPIRKVVRRARGVRWDATADVPHVEVAHGGAVVRAFVPAPLDHVPDVLARLQVGGTDVPDLGTPAAAVAGGVGVALTPAHPLSTGKAAAQCAHAAHLVWRSAPDGLLQRWRATGFAVRVLPVDADAWERALRSAPIQVRDAGYTEVPPGTVTSVAWPE
jgi:peptidyl-tRNA hydrolase